MPEKDALFTKMAPGEKIPVELCRDIKPNVYIAREGQLTFPPDPRYPGPDGKPRRLEWVRQASAAQTLTGEKYNKRGRPIVFKIAHDLLEKGQIENLQGQLRQAAGGMIDEAASEFNEALTDVSARLANVEKQMPAMEQRFVAQAGPIESLTTMLSGVASQVEELEARLKAMAKPAIKKAPGKKAPVGDAKDA